MKPSHSLLLKLRVTAALVCASLTAFGQDKRQRRQPDEVDDVIRTATELVQSDVTVVDKQNHFVPNLNADQFELFVDGKRQPIVFFERVTAGSIAEQRQLAAARRQTMPAENEVKPMLPAPVERGRVIFFFV